MNKLFITIISLALFSCKQPKESNIQITLECTSEIISDENIDINMNAIKAILKPFENCDGKYSSIPKLKIRRLDLDNIIEDITYKSELGNQWKAKIGMYDYQNAEDDYAEYIDELKPTKLMNQISVKDTVLIYENDSSKGIYSIYLKNLNLIDNKEIESIINSYKKQFCENKLKNITIRLIKAAKVTSIDTPIVEREVENIAEPKPITLKKAEIIDDTPAAEKLEQKFYYSINKSRNEISWTKVAKEFKVEIIKVDSKEVVYTSNDTNNKIKFPINNLFENILYRVVVSYKPSNSKEFISEIKSFSLINSYTVSPTCQF